MSLNKIFYNKNNNPYFLFSNRLPPDFSLFFLILVCCCYIFYFSILLHTTPEGFQQLRVCLPDCMWHLLRQNSTFPRSVCIFPPKTAVVLTERIYDILQHLEVFLHFLCLCDRFFLFHMHVYCLFCFVFSLLRLRAVLFGLITIINWNF